MLDAQKKAKANGDNPHRVNRDQAKGPPELRTMSLAAVAQAPSSGKVASSIESKVDDMAKVLTETVAAVQGIETDKDREIAELRAKMASTSASKKSAGRQQEMKRLQGLMGAAQVRPGGRTRDCGGRS